MERIRYSIVLLLLGASASSIATSASGATKVGAVVSSDACLSGSCNGGGLGGGIEVGFPLGATRRWAIFGLLSVSSMSGGNDADPVGSFVGCDLRRRYYLSSWTGHGAPFISWGVGGGVGPYTIAGFGLTQMGIEWNRDKGAGYELGFRVRAAVAPVPIIGVQVAVTRRFGGGPE